MCLLEWFAIVPKGDFFGFYILIWYEIQLYYIYGIGNVAYCLPHRAALAERGRVCGAG